MRAVLSPVQSLRDSRHRGLTAPPKPPSIAFRKYHDYLSRELQPARPSRARPWYRPVATPRKQKHAGRERPSGWRSRDKAVSRYEPADTLAHLGPPQLHSTRNPRNPSSFDHELTEVNHPASFVG